MAILILVQQISCVTSIEEAVEINPTAESDGAYYKVYSKYTREANVFDNFENKYNLTATVLSPEMRSSMASRYERLYKVQQGILEEASSKTGFFVSIFSPERGGLDLDDEVLWTIMVKIGETPRRPALVRRLGEKERWRPFFPEVNQWSKEFLIVFDEPLPDLATDDLVRKNSISLKIANADASVSLAW